MQKTTESYEYWRLRILYSTMLGYIFFYFIRKNLSLAMPLIEEDLGINKAQLGAFLTAHLLLYGVSRFVNGIIADRVNPRWFMSLGLILCAIANIGFGMSNTVWFMGVFWVINGWFQGMGFPPCAKSLTHWFAAEERGVKFSIWNTSHSIGAGVVLLLNSAVVAMFHDWRFCFFVPAGIAIFGAFFLFNRLRDTPESLGLEPIEEYYAKKQGTSGEVAKSDLEVVEKALENAPEHNDVEHKEENHFHTLMKYVYLNPAIWIISFANFFVYVVRFSILDWAPSFLKQDKGIDIAHAGIISSGYEFLGVLGMLASGLLMDRLFRGRGAKVCLLYMFGCTVSVALFWWVDSSNVYVNAAFLAVIGFFIYGPQCIIGVIAANLATKKAAAAANGLTGICGYASGLISGWGVGLIADKEGYGWNAVFLLLIAASFLAMLMFVFVLNAAAPEQLAAEEAEKNKA